MQDDPEQTNLKALNQWADKLACPACLKALRLSEAAVTCTSCGRIYPVVDGIPVLISDRAKKPDDENAPS
jgi:uncharacterized protein